MGRPRLPKPKISISITLFAETLKDIKRLGTGNVSAGVESIYQKYKEEKEAREKVERKLESCEDKNDKLFNEMMDLRKRLDG